MYPFVSEERIRAAIDDAKQLTAYRFPWNHLEESLAQQGQDHFWLIGYGSLLSHASAARTIDASDKAGREPAIAFGGRRQYSYRFSQGFLQKRYRTQGDYAALDCKVTHRPEDSFNGILTRVFTKDLEVFREREFAYDLRPVPVFRWFEPDLPPLLAYALDCPAESQNPGHPFTSGSDPLAPYHRLCRDGAASVSPEFLDCFLRTTYLGDGRTPISDWEIKNSF